MARKVKFNERTQRQWRRHDQAADYVLSRKALGDPTGHTPRPGDDDTNTVQIKNDSGADRRFGEILQVTDNALDSLDDRLIWLVGQKPGIGTGFGVLTKDLPKDEVGPCQISGVCIALVNITDLAHGYAATADDNAVLQSASSGPVRLLWTPGAEDEQSCIVRLEQIGGVVVDAVQVHHASASAGDTVSANADGVHAGRVERFAAGALGAAGDCWILLIDNYDTAAGNVDATQDEYYIGRKADDDFTSGGITLPLYLARKGAAAEETGIPFVNYSGERIPPHAVMYVPDETTIGDQEYLTAYKPGDEFDIFWLVNGDTWIDVDATGLGHFLCDDARPVLIGTEEGEPLDAISWGPKPNSWALWPERLGFSALTTEARGIAIVGESEILVVADFKQHEVLTVFGKLYTDLAQGGTAEFEVWLFEGGLRPAGYQHLTVQDFYLNKNESAKKGTKGRADWYSNAWVVDMACDVDNTASAQSSPGVTQGVPLVIGQGDAFSSSFTFSGDASTGSGTGTF